MTKWSIASALVGVALLLTTVSGQQQVRPSDFVDGEILIKFNPRTDDFRRNSVLSSRGVFRIRRFEALDIDYVRVPRGMAVRPRPSIGRSSARSSRRRSSHPSTRWQPSCGS